MRREGGSPIPHSFRIALNIEAYVIADVLKSAREIGLSEDHPLVRKLLATRFVFIRTRLFADYSALVAHNVRLITVREPSLTREWGMRVSNDFGSEVDKELSHLPDESREQAIDRHIARLSIFGPAIGSMDISVHTRQEKATSKSKAFALHAIGLPIIFFRYSPDCGSYSEAVARSEHICSMNHGRSWTEAFLGFASVANLDKIRNRHYFDEDIWGRFDSGVRLALLYPDIVEELERFAVGKRDPKAVAGFHLCIHELTHAIYFPRTWPYNRFPTMKKNGVRRLLRKVLQNGSR